MRILILGASGYLGSRLFVILQKYGTVFGTFNSNGFVSENMVYWDGDSKLLLHILTKLEPELVINCSGFAEVDQSEINPEKAFYLNAIVPHHISSVCQELNIKYVHISTDHYIGGKTLLLEEEMSVTCPNIYSASKLLGENYVLAANLNSIVVRANFFHFSKNSSNKFLDRCLNQPDNGAEIHGFQDIFYTPISTIYLASAIMTLVNQNFKGLIHVASSERISKYIFLKEIFRYMNKNQAAVKPKNWIDGQLKAMRPEDMSLSNKMYRSLVNESIPTISEMIKTELEFAGII
jgi:dTDP-4-dehydrorhamnose reductase